LLPTKTFKDQEHHNYGETLKIYNFYLYKSLLVKMLLQHFI
jgi:hypothetical protein